MSTVTLRRKSAALDLVLPEPKGTPEALKAAKVAWADCRAAHGFKRVATPFGTLPGDNQKYAKGKAKIFGLSLAPSRLSGINVCLYSTPICVRGCVAFSGNGMFPAVTRARIAKTRFLFEQPEHAAELLFDFLRTAEFSRLAGYEVGVRLNTFSDLDWQASAPWVFHMFPHLNYYNYTKDWQRTSSFDNYTIVFSASERTSDEEILERCNDGYNVAVVFDTRPSERLPISYMGKMVIDGDKTDERWKDPQGYIIGLRSKGTMRSNGGKMVRKCLPVT